MPTKPKTKFVIDRKRWYRGKGPIGSELRKSSGMMCCLGQVARQCGIKAKDITGLANPDEVDSLDDQAKLPNWFLDKDGDNTRECAHTMTINDSADISDRSRERQLKAIFKKHGATLTFIN